MAGPVGRVGRQDARRRVANCGCGGGGTRTGALREADGCCQGIQMLNVNLQGIRHKNDEDDAGGRICWGMIMYNVHRNRE